jgi:hypothetical protein
LTLQILLKWEPSASFHRSLNFLWIFSHTIYSPFQKFSVPSPFLHWCHLGMTCQWCLAHDTSFRVSRVTSYPLANNRSQQDDT